MTRRLLMDRGRPIEPHPIVADLLDLSAKAGLTVVELAERLGVGATSPYRWPTGEGAPSMAVLHRWAAVLGRELAVVDSEGRVLARGPALGAALPGLRRERRVTQARVARSRGISQSSIWRQEKAGEWRTLASVDGYVRALGLRLELVVAEEGP